MADAFDPSTLSFKKLINIEESCAFGGTFLFMALGIESRASSMVGDLMIELYPQSTPLFVCLFVYFVFFLFLF